MCPVTTRYRKATEQEKTEYARHNINEPYPLTGFVQVGGHWCPVVDLRPTRTGPRYEIIAPDGYHFRDPEEYHTMLCWTHADVLERAGGAGIEPCECDKILGVDPEANTKTLPGFSWRGDE